ncbi:hypothetical protein GWI33_014335 [Rhynchophorus ferrugineus]|uniref:Uncharacterized protein n=1 Tax=Rhynchophorus ferrugineus TaxID=354439 RepID=A0A834I7E0_RHYFE|nr:hypothetical protein GWI33_014335 [Rhynchophorus ferrugineus]
MESGGIKKSPHYPNGITPEGQLLKASGPGNLSWCSGCRSPSNVPTTGETPRGTNRGPELNQGGRLLKIKIR